MPTKKKTTARYLIEMPISVAECMLDVKMSDVEAARMMLKDSQIKMNERPKKLPDDENNTNTEVAIDPTKSKAAALVQLRRTQERLGQGLKPESDDEAITDALEETQKKLSAQKDLVGKTKGESKKILQATQALLAKESQLKVGAQRKTTKKAKK
jgi:hypothetical protein